MENTLPSAIEKMLEGQRQFFATHRTKDIQFRLEQLKKFRAAILRYKPKIANALWSDLHKSPEEAYMTEIGIVLQEIGHHMKHLKRWANPQKVPTPLKLFPSKSKVVYEPLGVALIIAPWNYPFMLMMNSLVGVISSGCCAILKASPYAPATAKVVEQLVNEIFPEDYIGIVQGNRDVNIFLLEQRFDIIFFTGSRDLGRKVMRAAAEHLTPVVLELGGKSPCIVDKDADIDIAAKRIAWGKTLNAGQICISPDYLFIHRSLKREFIIKFEEAIVRMFGSNCQESKHYPRIINRKSIERLKVFLQDANIIYGGEVNEQEKYVAPTLVDGTGAASHPVMQEEIFGPILPILTFDDINEVTSYVNSREKPLAIYYFGSRCKEKEILRKTSAGATCFNEMLLHIANHHLPFGGVGGSGIGKYHGKSSFMVFSNSRAIVSSPTWFDISTRYPPFTNFGILRKVLNI
ncbi:MAG: aldehyde dehydrogenase family protein [Prevotellaceae bacterium]|jgi:aldehyde dehydrogenase (NAD+)|nr:aldehyde dehydrogenase family protein [Prevotellaceae bacterium]